MPLTREGKVQETIENLFYLFGDNILSVNGRGSFFRRNQNGIYMPQDERDIDLDLVVDNSFSFYYNDCFDDKERINGLVLNEKIPLYFSNLPTLEGVRITVIPRNKLDSWVSFSSPIGYFLTGRWQKPVTQLYTGDEIKEELIGIREKAYDMGTELALKTLMGSHSLDEVIQNIFYQSYAAEGFSRSFEALFAGKHKSDFNKNPQKAREVYYDRIKLRAQELGRLSSEQTIMGVANGVELFNVWLNKKQFKRWAIPRYAKEANYLAQINANPKEFIAKKILRVMDKTSKKLEAKNKHLGFEFSKELAFNLAGLMNYYIPWKLGQLPSEIINDENIDIPMVSTLLNQMLLRMPVDELKLR